LNEFIPTLDNEPPSSFAQFIATDFSYAEQLPLLIAIIVLLILSALISGSEVSFFSINATQLQELKDANTERSRRVKALLQEPKQLLATILILNNFINVGIVIISTYVLNSLVDFGDNNTTAFVVEVVLITFIILLFGEILPKIYANSNVVTFAVFMAIPLSVMKKILYPIIVLLTKTSSFFKKPAKSSNFSVDDLGHALELTDNNHNNKEEQKMLAGIVRFGNTAVRQVMSPRTNVIAINIEANFAEVLENIAKTGFSRFPVFQTNIDNIKGLVYIKDLLPYLDASPEFAWQKLLRNPFFVPETKKIDDLLVEFQSKKTHLAVVVDEFGGTSGIITLEDVIEEIVGEISDEFDSEDLIFSKLDANTFVFEGKTPLNDFYRLMEVDGNQFEQAKGDADTLAGMLLEIWGKFPEKNEALDFNGYNFKIENIENRRIQRIKVTRIQAT